MNLELVALKPVRVMHLLVVFYQYQYNIIISENYKILVNTNPNDSFFSILVNLHLELT